jgi:hypothetical protein
VAAGMMLTNGTGRRQEDDMETVLVPVPVSSAAASVVATGFRHGTSIRAGVNACNSLGNSVTAPSADVNHGNWVVSEIQLDGSIDVQQLKAVFTERIMAVPIWANYTQKIIHPETNIRKNVFPEFSEIPTFEDSRVLYTADSFALDDHIKVYNSDDQELYEGDSGIVVGKCVQMDEMPYVHEVVAAHMQTHGKFVHIPLFPR